MTTLKDVHEVLRKWLYLKNTNRVDVILATYLSRVMEGTKLWIIFIGGSGAAKSEILRALDDGITTRVVQEFTPNTLVSGNPCGTDLAPLLRNKVMLILDMAILLNLKKDDKAKVWAQLRELYDGNAGKDVGSGKKGTDYHDLNITLLANSTGAIDDQILIHQALGTRELLFRIDAIEEDVEEEKLMNKVLENEKNEVLMRKEIKEVIQSFIKQKKYCDDIKISENTLIEIKKYVTYLRIMRTSASHDSYSGELTSTAESESPTRVLKQFIRMFKSLKSLDENYSDEQALNVLKEIRDSSCNQDRIKVINVLAKNYEDYHSITDIGSQIRLGKSSVFRHLQLLWNLKLIDRKVELLDYGKEKYTWKINEKNKLSKNIIQEHHKDYMDKQQKNENLEEFT